MSGAPIDSQLYAAVMARRRSSRRPRKLHAPSRGLVRTLLKNILLSAAFAGLVLKMHLRLSLNLRIDLAADARLTAHTAVGWFAYKILEYLTRRRDTAIRGMTKRRHHTSRITGKISGRLDVCLFR